MSKHKFNMRRLRISLKYRPEIFKLILKMRQCIKNKKASLKQLTQRVKEMERIIAKKYSKHIAAKSKSAVIVPQISTTEVPSSKSLETSQVTSTESPDVKISITEKLNTQDISTQTDFTDIIEKDSKSKESDVKPENSGWDINKENETKSIAEQVKEAAHDAMKQSGMVYVESAGMYYDYKTGYYYNSELGLYYHTDTECYYYYSDEKQSFVFHSYPDRSTTNAEAALIAHKRKIAKKHKMDRKAEEDIGNLTKNLSQGIQEDAQDDVKPKPKKSKKRVKKSIEDPLPKDKNDDIIAPNSEENVVNIDNKDVDKNIGNEKEELMEVDSDSKELEDGECSETSSEDVNDDENSSQAGDTTSSDIDDESIAKHHPPCMRVIVRETTLPKLRVGTLFIVTKDGGTIGREGDQHTILLKDSNVSRNHMVIKYDEHRKSYMATDLGSKNGSILNGTRMSESQINSESMQIVHGSTLILGETKLLCHIHPGNDTCGHCEPGLLMENIEKEKKIAYTRTCSVKRQHELELARLKNKYGTKPLLAIEETAYNDRAQARRDAVGSSHSAEKTQTSDIATSIAPDNKGFKLLEKMGWNKGEGLGKDSQGDVEPVPLISNEGKTGLGAVPTPSNPANTLGPATIKLASRTKMLKPPAKAFQGILNEDSD